MISIINEHRQLLAVLKGFNIKRSMIGEICSRIELDLTDQHGEREEGIVLRIFICHSSPCLSGVGRMAELQGFHNIVTEHDVTAIVEGSSRQVKGAKRGGPSGPRYCIPCPSSVTLKLLWLAYSRLEQRTVAVLRLYKQKIKQWTAGSQSPAVK